MNLAGVTMLAVVCSCVAFHETAEAEQPTSNVATASLTEAGSTVSLPGLTIHGGEKKWVEAAGAVALTTGILEFAGVEPGGRDYESLFTLRCKPSALQYALLLIGCEPGPLPRRTKPGERPGDRLEIAVEWKVDSNARRVPLEQLLLYRKTKKPPTDLTWHFTGSYFSKNLEGQQVFMADVEQAHIALWWNPAILVNVGGDYGNPYQHDDEGFEPNTNAVPAKKTPITLIFRKHE